MAKSSIPREDLTGREFEEWTVLSEAPRSTDGRYSRLWHCQCSCGSIVTVLHASLTSGKSTQCKTCANKVRRKLHGFSKTLTYNSWCGMKQRCYYRGNISYVNYGNRKIEVCERWLDFKSFLSDMGERPGKGYSVERKDNNKGYSPENCVWATRSEQMQNKRNNVRLTHRGETLTLAAWVRKLGIKQSTLCGRLKRGWSVAKSLDTPVG